MEIKEADHCDRLQKYNIAGHLAYKIFSKGHSVTPLPGRLFLFYIRKLDNNVLGQKQTFISIAHYI